MRRTILAAPLLLALLLPAHAAPVRLAGDADRLARASVEAMLSCEYLRATILADSVSRLDASHPAGWLLKALAAFARYDDLTDPAEVAKAETALGRADSLAAALGDGFWKGIAEYERGLLLAMRGQTMKGMLATRSGAVRLSRLKGNDDASALSAVYDYYLSEAISWLPFVADERENAQARLARGVDSTLYFGAVYREALVWIHWAKGEFDEGLALVDPVLEAHPANRVFRQIRGDLLRKAGRYDEAREAYSESLRQYREVSAEESVRGVCALGNLALIEHFRNDFAARDAHLARFRELLPAVEKRMPKSLLEELRREKLN